MQAKFLRFRARVRVRKVTGLFFRSWKQLSSFVASFVVLNIAQIAVIVVLIVVLIVIDARARAGPARRRATRRSRVGTPQPVPTRPVPKRPVPTRLRRVAHSNGRAIRLGIRTAVNAGRRRRHRATRRSRVGTPLRRAARARHGWRGAFPYASDGSKGLPPTVADRQAEHDRRAPIVILNRNSRLQAQCYNTNPADMRCTRNLWGTVLADRNT